MDNISTVELVRELEQREGVSVITAEPYEGKNIAIEGPAVVLIIL